MKATKAFTLSLLLFTSLLYSQSNTFKLGVTGACCNFGFTACAKALAVRRIVDFGLI